MIEWGTNCKATRGETAVIQLCCWGAAASLAGKLPIFIEDDLRLSQLLQLAIDKKLSSSAKQSNGRWISCNNTIHFRCWHTIIGFSGKFTSPNIYLLWPKCTSDFGSHTWKTTGTVLGRFSFLNRKHAACHFVKDKGTKAIEVHASKVYLTRLRKILISIEWMHLLYDISRPCLYQKLGKDAAGTAWCSPNQSKARHAAPSVKWVVKWKSSRSRHASTNAKLKCHNNTEQK